jgi:hypothetical protein
MIGKSAVCFGSDSQLSTNVDNARLLAGKLSASVYTNIVKVGSPEIRLTRTAVGALHEECIPDTRKPQFNTRDNDEVSKVCM